MFSAVLLSFFYLYVMFCNFVCFICTILLPSGVINDDDIPKKLATANRSRVSVRLAQFSVRAAGMVDHVKKFSSRLPSS